MTAPQPVERLALRPAEAAKAIGVSERAIYYMINAGEIPSVLVGRKRLIRMSYLQEWLDALE